MRVWLGHTSYIHGLIQAIVILVLVDSRGKGQ